MKQHYIDEKQVSLTRCKAIIICQISSYPPKKKRGLLEYGGNGIYGI